ncbi:MAG: tRNA-(ms[2]io[6]A)-hydroxylase [Halopseudomonas sp.]
MRSLQLSWIIKPLSPVTAASDLITLMNLPQELIDFLPCRTPEAWVNQALAHPEELLIDHANCEKKAASTALNLMFRYIDKPLLLQKMSRLAREELRHFEQVTALMQKRGVVYRGLSASHYAQRLRQHVRTVEPGRLVDTLIVGAFIEARSCERFACLAPHLDAELGEFYRSLLKSEARHYQDYLGLARQFAEGPIDDRVALFAQLEGLAVIKNDTEFRFHSGALEAPAKSAAGTAL